MEDQTAKPDFIQNLDPVKKNGVFPIQKLIIFIVIALFVGIGAGFALNKAVNPASQTKTSGAKAGTKVGISDKKTFRDKAEGTLREGGVDGEGNFHLERPGGQSQNVYLTSTTVDLSSFVGKKVRVWGETFQAEKAGWLMDVGLVEVLQ